MGDHPRLSLPVRASVRVTVFTAGEVASGVDSMITDFVDSINDVRAAGRAQAIVTGFRDDIVKHKKVVEVLQKAFDDMSFPDERFVVSAPRRLDEESVRIDITRTGPEQGAEPAEASTDVIERMSAEQMRVLPMTIKEFLERARIGTKPREKTLITQLEMAMANWLMRHPDSISHTWHLCERGVTVDYQRLWGVGKVGERWLTEELARHDLCMPMKFHHDDRATLVAVTRDYKK